MSEKRYLKQRGNIDRDQSMPFIRTKNLLHTGLWNSELQPLPSLVRDVVFVIFIAMKIWKHLYNMLYTMSGVASGQRYIEESGALIHSCQSAIANSMDNTKKTKQLY